MLRSNMLILGTALWTWSVPKKECFALLDTFYTAGYREIDIATNYPINKDGSFFRAAEKVLEEWIKINNIEDLEVIVKVGSLDNSGSPHNNLTKSFLLMSYDYYAGELGSNLGNFMIHWDNRNSEKALRETCEALKIINDKGVGIGLSGIKHPEVYHKLSKELDLIYTIEIKHNIFDSALFHYKSFFGENRFIGYGLNCGGIKFGKKYSDKSSAVLRRVNTDEFHKRIEKLKGLLSSPHRACIIEVKSFNDIAMIHAINSRELSGIIIGPSKIDHLNNSMDFWHKLKKEDSIHIYNQILNICEEVRS